MKQPLVSDIRGKSMLAPSEMMVVFVLVQSIRPGIRKDDGGAEA